MKFTLEAGEGARVIGNALAHFPAKNLRLNHLEIAFADGRMTAIGSDGYTAGMDWCESTNSTALVIHLERGEAQNLEAMLRRNKKHLATITVVEDTLTATAGEDDDMEIVECRTAFDQDDRTKYQFIMDAIAARENVDTVAMIDPALINRFGKVKTADGDRMADFRWDRQGIDPMFVKVGPTFVGLVVPIDREKNAETYGTEGQWND